MILFSIIPVIVVSVSIIDLIPLIILPVPLSFHLDLNAAITNVVALLNATVWIILFIKLINIDATNWFV